MSSKLSTLLTSNPKLGSALVKADGFYLYNSAGSGTDQSAGVTLGEFIKGLLGYNASSNASGNTTVTPGALAVEHIEVTAVTGSGATTRKFVLSVANSPAAGTRLVHRVNLPTTSGITLEWRGSTVGGVLLTSYVTDASGDDVVAEFYFDGSDWQFLRFSAPANA